MMTSCWECETTTSQPMVVMIRVPTGHLGPFMLCPTCYRVYYLPLSAEASADGAHRDPPLATRGAWDTRRTSPLMLEVGRD